ncbi:MAG: NADPH-dependent FMN reductase [bacterium]
MLKNSLTSPSPLVNPREALSAANGLLPHRANRFSVPFVSIEKSQKPETNRMVGNTSQPMFVSIIVGAVGKNRVAVEVAKFIAQEIAKRNGVETEMVDLGNLADAQLAQAEAMILVMPEYNYGFPDVLKNVLARNLPEHAGRVVGICDLSPGWFGGSRLFETLLPMMRKSGLIPIFWNENRSTGEEFFDTARGERIDSFLNELLWMAMMLRQRRKNNVPN